VGYPRFWERYLNHSRLKRSHGFTLSNLASTVEFAYSETYPYTTSDVFESSPVEITSAAPIPGAVWLFGPGLAGLIGLKRKYLG